MAQRLVVFAIQNVRDNARPDAAVQDARNRMQINTVTPTLPRVHVVHGKKITKTVFWKALHRKHNKH